MVGILGANSLSGGGYEIDNSLRFNLPDAAALRKTFSGSPTATQKCTFSFWTKLANPSVTTSKTIFSAIKSGSSEDRFNFHGINNGIHGGFELAFNNGNDGTMYIGTGGNTLVRFRDSSAWYHFIIAIDSTQGTASNRVKVYVNGVLNEVESRIDGGAITTDVVLTEDYTLGFLTAGAHSIGENVESAGSEAYDGYLADFNFIDGTQNAHTDFGEVDDNGVWIPKAYTGTYGNYGFFLEFKQTGTGTDASGMGADTSGNDNHFAPVNLAALDVMPDTPTNNWCTYNPLDLGQSLSGATFSQGNLSVTTTTAFEDQVGSTFSLDSGKWYWETKIQSNQNRESIGAILVGTGLTGGAARVQYYSRNGAITLLNSSIATGATYGNNDIISVTLDLDNNVAKFFKNNALQGTVNSLTAGTWVPAYFDNSNGVGALAVTGNFGQDGTFAGAETAGDNADANGFGNFKYAVPSGFYSLCTKNLAEFG